MAATSDFTLKFLSGTLTQHSKFRAHRGDVTAIRTVPDQDMYDFMSASRDKCSITWKRSLDDSSFEAQRSFHGHNHFIQDLALSSDGKYAFSASWDNTCRMRDLTTKATAQKFLGHTKDVLSVDISPDNRQIITASRDNTIKLWNTMGQCKFTFTEDGHSGWVSCVRFSPIVDREKPAVFVSCGWDKLVKVWDLTSCKLKYNFAGHKRAVNDLAISPDGSLCASGDAEGAIHLWDLNEGKFLYVLKEDGCVHAMAFHSVNFWFCAAIDHKITVWDLESHSIIEQIQWDLPLKDTRGPNVLCLSWSPDGSMLYAGYQGGDIVSFRVTG